MTFSVAKSLYFRYALHPQVFYAQWKSALLLGMHWIPDMPAGNPDREKGRISG